MQSQQGRRFEDNRGAGQPARADEACAQSSDYPIERTEIRRALSRPIQDQQLVLDEHGLSHHGAGATGPDKPGDGRQQMQKQNGQITHGSILPTV